MDKDVILLRFCYWLGAILDGRAAILLTLIRFHDLPTRTAALQLPHEFGIQTLRVAGDAAALMWGWTALLLWADRKPVERRGVLLLTSVPVILILLAQMVQLWLAGFVAFGQIAFWLCLLIGLESLFAFSSLYISSDGNSDCAAKSASLPAASSSEKRSMAKSKCHT